MLLEKMGFYEVLPLVVPNLFVGDIDDIASFSDSLIFWLQITLE